MSGLILIQTVWLSDDIISWKNLQKKFFEKISRQQKIKKITQHAKS